MKVVRLKPGWTRKIHGAECSNEAEHTPHPMGYLAWFDWAERMSKTHTQILCSGCNRWAIWIAREDDK